MLSPDFEWPDAPTPFYGCAVLSTGDAEWQDLNSTIATFEGSANLGTGQLLVEARAFEPTGALAAQATQQQT